MERDPFPMTSPEAQRMVGSVGDRDSSNWHTMTTSTEGRDPQKVENSEQDASESLVKGGAKKSKKSTPTADDDDDIYADADVEDDDIQEDEFFDRPLSDLRGSRLNRTLGSITRFLRKLYTRLYGEKLPPSEMVRTLCLASTLFFMIGGYWLLRSLKDPVLTALCGVEYIPKAKMLSVFVVLGVVTVYNYLLDSDIPHHKLFYIFGTFYFALFTTISFLLMHETYGLPNPKQDPTRLLGWISYCSIESFGSVMVSLFWSFANSNFSLESAKASYGVMVATAQIGSILGPTVVNQYAETIGPAKCYLIGGLCMLLLQGTMRLYISKYGAQERNAVGKTKKERAGILEGVELFIQHNYVKGIFAISCLFMVEVTIVDYTMKVLAQRFFNSEYPCQPGDPCEEDDAMSEEAIAAFATFMGFFGQATNTLSFLMSLLGTSAVIRYLGLRLTLLLFPSICLMVIIFVRLHPTLYVVFLAMMILKACSYALNNPTKEILYQPTSSAVRYKAKSWIDIFGARGSKALGSLVTNAFSDSASSLVANGSLVGMGVATFLIFNARYMGKKFDEYTESGYVVGASNEVDTEEQNIQMAIAQNRNRDTSCAIDDDDEVGREEEGQEDDQEGSEDGDEDDDGGDPEGDEAEVIMV